MNQTTMRIKGQAAPPSGNFAGNGGALPVSARMAAVRNRAAAKAAALAPQIHLTRLYALIITALVLFCATAWAGPNDISNTAGITFNDGVTVSSNSVVLTRAEAVDCAVEKSADTDRAMEGNNVSYRITAINNSDVPIIGLVVRDDLPEGVSLVETSPTATSVEDRRLTWNIGNLAPRQQTVVTVTVLVNENSGFAGQTLVNTAAATTAQADSDLNNNIATAGVMVRTPGVIELLRYAPSVSTAESVNVAVAAYSSNGSLSGPFSALAPPLSGQTPIDLSQPVPLIDADVFHQGDPIFIRVTDRDRNTDPNTVETIVIKISGTGPAGTDTEVILLTETGLNTGVFTGYVMSAPGTAPGNYDGRLAVSSGTTITAVYHDTEDGPEAVVDDSALVDPYGIVFDSSTGKPVDGAVVTIVEAAAGVSAAVGAPARVLGEDGVSTYPSTLISGAAVTDSGGNRYDPPAGGFRFPLILPGNYRLRITPPEGYKAPSIVADADLQALPGGPFVIVKGSRGESFRVDPGPPVHLDIPIDPIVYALYVTKQANKDTAAAGDFVAYTLTVENTSDDPISGIVLNDKLPPGFRYQNGSSRRDKAKTADPAIASDGRTLTFSIGTLASHEKTTIVYVVEVSAGARKGKAVNRAVAVGDTASSLPASATVEVKEDLFRGKAIIMGRVIADNCENKPVDGNDGVPGVRVYLEDGTFAVTDDNGMYHFEGVVPGTHVVQMDLVTIPERYQVVACEENTRFAQTPYSQFVDLQGGTLWRADFHVATKPRPEGEARLYLESTRAGDQASFYARLSGDGVALDNLRLTLLLPEGVIYTEGSSRLSDGTPITPMVTDNALTYRLGDVPAAWEKRITLSATIRSIFTNGEESHIVTKGLLTFNTPAQKNQRTPVVESLLAVRFHNAINLEADQRPLFASFGTQLTENDKEQVRALRQSLAGRRIKRIIVTGHTDNQPIRARSRHIFADNDALSLGRAQSVATYLQTILNLPPERIEAEGKGDREPVASNATEAGRAENRRVAVAVVSESIRPDTAASNDADLVSVATRGARPGEDPAAGKKPYSLSDAEAQTMPEISRAFVESLSRDDRPLAWVWPEDGFLPATPGIKIAVRHRAGTVPRLLLNGHEVSRLNFEKTVSDRAGTVAVSTWRGVDLKEGDNRFEALWQDPDTATPTRIERVIHYSGPPVRADLVVEKSRLIADGSTPPVIAVRLTDKDGFPARTGVVGRVNVLPPYTALAETQTMQQAPLTGAVEDAPGYRVEADGMAYIPLDPSAPTGKATLEFTCSDGTKTVSAWLIAPDREWILVGLAEGTVGYNTLSGHAENLAAADVDDEIYEDGRIAFFAKGRIKGEWLLTLAADTTEEKAAGETEMFRTIDPDTYYTLYGDTVQQGYEAPSRKRLYVKIEKKQFYALFGDYATDLTVTELARYNRNATGIKSEFENDRFTYTAFVNEADSGFIKDEIQGNGTSGLYHLSGNDILPNSETIIIETRDRFKSEVILESRPLTRHVDYQIDYDTGALFFKEPVFSRDDRFNPIFIVADYETEAGDSGELNYGGRAAVKFLDGRVEVGASHLHEGGTGAEGDLSGADATVRLSKNTTVRAEVATSDKQSGTEQKEGNAYLAEMVHGSEKLAGKLYVREQQPGFGLGQQNGSEEGTRKIGGEAAYQATSRVGVNAEVYRQENLTTDAKRDVAEAGVSYATGRDASLRAGLRHAEDRFSDGTVNRTDQVLAGATTKTANDKLTLRVDHEQTLNPDENANADFPTRTTLGADYAVTEKTTLFAEQEFTFGENEDTETSRAGVKTSPWTGGSLSSSVGRETDENGARVFAGMGLSQKWRINDYWSADGGIDHSRTLKDPGNTPLNINVPPASGTADGNDFTAFSLGTAYTQETWSANNRVEFRHSEVDDKYGLMTGIFGEPKEGLGLSSSFRLFRTETVSGTDTTAANLRFGLARRPRNAEWIVLDRLDLVYEDETGTSSAFESRRIINNLNANFKPNGKFQVSLQYGAKYVLETVEDNDYSGYTDLTGIEARYDITRRFDVGMHGGMLHSWNSGQIDYLAGASLGCDIVKNFWLSFGYNLTGFTDKDFSAAGFTAQGPFIQFRLKFDQATVKEAVELLDKH
ncbi:OmpA family protein [Desulfosudis oleivorans]|uniref:Conserved repeat domain n=1 Tax=Desulfosudis oleivorans (strain DSM 6200 / JCM 39069 / Hxd3) TaxID=96561 RepID=A9A0P0_DESOH|nr:OmpA family protein [Desulfosudis oleivorans]ABW69057.1 conserved repeat domain [Desulfosudis oleivorans Hxd3]